MYIIIEIYWKNKTNWKNLEWKLPNYNNKKKLYKLLDKKEAFRLTIWKKNNKVNKDLNNLKNN
jgi:hypothetical protein